MPRLRSLIDGAVAIALGAAAALGLLCDPAGAAGGPSAVYCLKGPDTLAVFAAQAQPKGRLKFGISYWNPEQHNVVVYGLARRAGGHWDYADHMGADDRCRLDIVLSPDGTARIIVDPKADCENRGGYGTQIDTISFPKSAYEGPVTFELNDEDTLFNKAGKCWK